MKDGLPAGHDPSPAQLGGAEPFGLDAWRVARRVKALPQDGHCRPVTSAALARNVGTEILGRAGKVALADRAASTGRWARDTSRMRDGEVRVRALTSPFERSTRRMAPDALHGGLGNGGAARQPAAPHARARVVRQFRDGPLDALIHAYTPGRARTGQQPVF